MRQINSTNNVTVTGSKTPLIAANVPRAGVIVTNLDANNPVYIGNADVTTAAGYTLRAGRSITIPVQSALYGITGGSSVSVTLMEIQ